MGSFSSGRRRYQSAELHRPELHIARSISETADSSSVGVSVSRPPARSAGNGAFFAVGFGDIEPDRRGQDLRDRLVGHARGLAVRRPARVARAMQVGGVAVDPAVGVVARAVGGLWSDADIDVAVL